MEKMTTIDSRIEQLYQRLSVPVSINDVVDLAGNLNTEIIAARVPWVNKLLEIDRSLGVGGFIIDFDVDRFGIFQLLKYDEIYRPMKYVYLDICDTGHPAAFSRNIAENACAHVEKCLGLYLKIKSGARVPPKPKPTLGRILGYSQKFLDSDSSESIRSLNELVYGKTKHKFDVALPRQQLLSLTESLLIYFVSRKIGVHLLTACGAINDVTSEIIRGQTEENAYVGQVFK